MTKQSSHRDNTAIFEQLWGITLELRQKLEARFELHPNLSTQDLQSYCTPTGEANGSLNTFSGPEITWLVHSWIKAPQLNFCNIHLTVWLGSQVRVPHFAFVVGTVPQLFFYIDYVPRSDLSVDLQSFDRYYEPVNEIFANLQSDSAFERFVSKDVYMRQAMSPSHLCYTCPLTEEKISQIHKLALQMFNLWLTWVDEAEIVPQHERNELSARDLLVRRTVAERDPDNKIAVGLFGEELTNKLVRALWGG